MSTDGECDTSSESRMKTRAGMKSSRVSGSKCKWVTIRILFAVAIVSIVVVTLRRQITGMNSEVTSSDAREASLELMEENVVNMDESEEEDEDGVTRDDDEENDIDSDSELDTEQSEEDDEDFDVEEESKRGKDEEEEDGEEEDEEEEEVEEEDRKAIKGLEEDEGDEEEEEDESDDKGSEDDESDVEIDDEENGDDDEEDKEEDEDKAEYKDDDEENKSTGEKLLGSFLSMFGSKSSDKGSNNDDDGDDKDDKDKDTLKEKNSDSDEEDEKDEKGDDDDDGDADNNDKEDAIEPKLVQPSDKDQPIHKLSVTFDGVDSQDYKDNEDDEDTDEAADVKIEPMPVVAQGSVPAQDMQVQVGQTPALASQIQPQALQSNGNQQQQLMPNQQLLQQQQQQQQQQPLQSSNGNTAPTQQNMTPEQEQQQTQQGDQNTSLLPIKELLSPEAYNLLVSKKLTLAYLLQKSVIVRQFLIRAGYPKDAELVASIASQTLRGNQDQIPGTLPQDANGQQSGIQAESTNISQQIVPSQSGQTQVQQQSLGGNAGPLLQQGVPAANGVNTQGQQISGMPQEDSQLEAGQAEVRPAQPQFLPRRQDDLGPGMVQFQVPQGAQLQQSGPQVLNSPVNAQSDAPGENQPSQGLVQQASQPIQQGGQPAQQQQTLQQQQQQQQQQLQQRQQLLEKEFSSSATLRSLKSANVVELFEILKDSEAENSTDESDDEFDENTDDESEDYGDNENEGKDGEEDEDEDSDDYGNYDEDEDDETDNKNDESDKEEDEEYDEMDDDDSGADEETALDEEKSDDDDEDEEEDIEHLGDNDNESENKVDVNNEIERKQGSALTLAERLESENGRKDGQQNFFDPSKFVTPYDASAYDNPRPLNLEEYALFRTLPFSGTTPPSIKASSSDDRKKDELNSLALDNQEKLDLDGKVKVPARKDGEAARSNDGFIDKLSRKPGEIVLGDLDIVKQLSSTDSDDSAFRVIEIIEKFDDGMNKNMDQANNFPEIEFGAESSMPGVLGSIDNDESGADGFKQYPDTVDFMKMLLPRIVPNQLITDSPESKQRYDSEPRSFIGRVSLNGPDSGDGLTINDGVSNIAEDDNTVNITLEAKLNNDDEEYPEFDSSSNDTDEMDYGDDYDVDMESDDDDDDDDDDDLEEYDSTLDTDSDSEEDYDVPFTNSTQADAAKVESKTATDFDDIDSDNNVTLSLASTPVVVDPPVDPSKLCPREVKLAKTSHPVTALVMFPGTATEWIKEVLQQLTGQETDSIYNIMASLKNGNAAGVYQMSKKVAIETHAPSDRNFERAIVVIGNPYAVEAGHTIFRPFSVEWQKNFLWERTYTAWLSSRLPLHVISYEDMVEAPLTEIIKLASFVGGEGVDLNYDCALSVASTSPPMMYDVSQITGIYRTERRRINAAVDNVIKAATHRGLHTIIPRLESFKLYAGQPGL